MIDYRELLKAYIRHVGICEGVTFINEGSMNFSKALTVQQRAELFVIEEELYKELP